MAATPDYVISGLTFGGMALVAQRHDDNATPLALGYRMPAEWERQAATWLIWPEHPDHWYADLEAVQRSVAKLAAAIAQVQQVHLLVNDAHAGQIATKALEAAGASSGVFLHSIANDLCWMRDCGPTFVVREVDGKHDAALVGWRYNAWGGKYPPWDNDAAVPGKLAAMLGLRLFEPGIVLEGGSIEVNGAGDVLTTEQCLLHPNRNPDLKRSDIERLLNDYLGCGNAIWLGEGIEGDDTDGHIDDIARFVNRDTILAVVEPDPKDPNHAPLADNLRRLQLARLANGKRPEVAHLPMPPALWIEGRRFPASYANYYLANDRVIVPTFGAESSDLAAISLLGQLFHRTVIGIDARALVTGFGAFHCVTQQQPSVG